MLRSLVVALAATLLLVGCGPTYSSFNGLTLLCEKDAPGMCPGDAVCDAALGCCVKPGWLTCMTKPAADGGTASSPPDLAEPPPCALGAKVTQLGPNAVGCHGTFDVGKMPERCGAWRVCGQWDAAEIDFDACERVAGSFFYSAAFVRPEPQDENKYPPPKIHCGDWSDGKGGIANNAALLSCGGRMNGVTLLLPKNTQTESCPDNILRFSRITACGMAPSAPGCTFTPNPTSLNVGNVLPNDGVLCCRPKK